MGAPPPTRNCLDELVVSRWPSTPRSVARARHHLRDVLRSWNLSELSDTAELVLTELATNAVVHGKVRGRQIETKFFRRGGGVRIEVHDASYDRPERRRPAEEDEQGRGLALVNALVGPEQWGVSEREGVGKSVWAQVNSGGSDGFGTSICAMDVVSTVSAITTSEGA
ncbi:MULTISPECIES: ATP-binding protein [unclassified Streptomyces]|uniref:ATP-binding protein n=1 Tax=unclassified Streptomyces TaxID=2593676 RepID=UPI002E289D5C|nr:ATP-binding protein [Streptomyces sp. NBC_00223]